MAQIPAALPVTTFPLTVQTDGVALLKLTARPEEAAADNVDEPPTEIVDGEKSIKPMVWVFALATLVLKSRIHSKRVIYVLKV